MLLAQEENILLRKHKRLKNKTSHPRIFIIYYNFSAEVIIYIFMITYILKAN